MKPVVILLVCALLLPSQTPRIHVDTRLVEVNVIVRDRNNRPVEGLTKADFKVFDRNKPQNIAVFSAISSGAATKAPPPLPAGVYTNRPEQRGDAPPAVTVILLDAINTSVQDQMFAKQEFMKFLRQLRPEDRVAVYSLGTQLRVLHDFTNDTQSLIDVLSKFGAHDPVPSWNVGSGDTGAAPFGIWLQEKNTFSHEDNTLMRVRTTVSAMEAISNHIGHLLGRKNLIWITGSFPFMVGGMLPLTSGREPMGYQPRPPNPGAPILDLTRFDDYVTRAVRALNDANIAVYPVDARGLTVFPGGVNSGSLTIPRQVRVGLQPVFNGISEGRDVMNVMAESTGGRAFYNTNDIEHAIRDAIDDSELTYTLGFYADASARGTEFRKLKVEVHRSDVQLGYRNGYLATPAAAATDQDRQAAIDDALWSPLDAAGISIAGRMVRLPALKTDSVKLSLSLNAADLMFAGEGDKSNASMEFTFALLTKTGVVLEKMRQEMMLDLNPPQRDEFMKRFVVDKTVQLKPEVAQIRVVLLDRASGPLGSLTLPVK